MVTITGQRRSNLCIGDAGQVVCGDGEDAVVVHLAAVAASGRLRE